MRYVSNVTSTIIFPVAASAYTCVYSNWIQRGRVSMDTCVYRSYIQVVLQARCLKITEPNPMEKLTSFGNSRPIPWPSAKVAPSHHLRKMAFKLGVAPLRIFHVFLCLFIFLFAFFGSFFCFLFFCVSSEEPRIPNLIRCKFILIRYFNLKDKNTSVT